MNVGIEVTWRMAALWGSLVGGLVVVQGVGARLLGRTPPALVLRRMIHGTHQRPDRTVGS